MNHTNLTINKRDSTYEQWIWKDHQWYGLHSMGMQLDLVGGYGIIRWFLHVLTTTNESWIWVCLKIAIIFPYRFYISHFKRTHDVLNRWRALFSNKPTWWICWGETMRHCGWIWWLSTSRHSSFRSASQMGNKMNKMEIQNCNGIVWHPFCVSFHQNFNSSDPTPLSFPCGPV